MKKIEKILIRFPNWLGDIIMALPLVEALKKNYPEAKLYALVKAPFHEVLTKDPRFEQVISFKAPKNLLNKLNPFFLKNQLKEDQFDIAILCTRSLSSALQLMPFKIDCKIGQKRAFGSLLLDYCLTFHKKKHQRLQYLQLLEPFGIQDQTIYTPLVSSFNRIKEESLPKFDTSKSYIVLHPGASYGSAKTWPLEYYEKLALKLVQELKMAVVFCGDAKQSPPRIQDPLIFDLTGKTTLSDLSHLIQHAACVICNDSGPMHIADAVGTKLLAIFGPTDPELTGPKNSASFIMQHKTHCGPCFKRTCPLAHECMHNIIPDQVFEKTKLLLSAHGPS